MKQIQLQDIVGKFAEDKDKAREIRIGKLVPFLESKEEIILDFEGIELTTQSFIHALISDLIRKYGNSVLDRIYFKNCNKNIQGIIDIVVEYMQA